MVNTRLGPSGYPIAPAAPAARTLSLAGFAATTEFGTPEEHPGAVTLSPSGLASSNAIGSPVFSTGAVTIRPSGFADADGFGAPAFTTGAVTITAPGFADPDAFGIPVLQLKKKAGQGGGAKPGSVSGAQKYASRITMSEAGLIVALEAQSSVARIVNTRMVLYADQDGLPGALLAQSAVKTSVVLGSNNYPLLTSYAVTANTPVWAALHSDGNFNWFLSAGSNSRFNADAFDDGPSDPFGVSTQSNNKAPVFVIYLGAVTLSLHTAGFADADQVGAPSLIPAVPQTITAQGFANSVAFGTSELRVASATITATGFSDTDAFGAIVLRQAQVLALAGFVEAHGFGAATLTGGAAPISPPVAGPYYFSWIDQPDPAALRDGTAFDPDVHNRMDEYIFSFKRILSEGDKPRLQIVIRNPHIGLLNPSRKQWAWFARDIEGTITPLFCGRLIAAPKDIFKELMTVDLVAWPLDYNAQRQKLADEIKKNGPYSAVFTEVTKRSDPDALIEAISGLYHIDPVSHVVTISDVLNGEDGNVDVTADDHLYDGMVRDLDQNFSLTAILMDATVTWNQTWQGFIDMGRQVISSYAGDAIIAEWPKPLQQLGGGYTVATSSAVDANGVNGIVTATSTYSWTNKAREHSDGDELSHNQSVTAPAGMQEALSTVLTQDHQDGFLDPFATDGDGDPSPTNIPPHDHVTFAYVPLWQVNTSLTLMCRDLERTRTERIRILLQSDLQPIIVRPEVEQNSEVIVKTGADVGIPIVDLLNWTSVAGEAVEEGAIVFPDNPSLPTLRTAQICTTPGIAGLTEPDFSDIPGETTNDNSVVWASLGTPSPTETAFDWTANTNVGLGTMILPRRPMFIAYGALIAAGLQQYPKVGTQISRSTIIQDGNGNFQVCTLPGLTGIKAPTFSGTRGFVTTDGSVEWTCLGNKLPDGKTHFLCVQAGRTGFELLIPQFDNTLHAQTIDGTAVWASIGPGRIPAGGTPGDVWARSYFTTADGLKDIEWLISVMRARGRFKARAVSVDFVPISPFGLGLQLTLRKTASVHDSRLGGIATGKLIRVEHACEGRTGRETCRARMGCAIGKDNVIEAVSGEPTWAEADFCGNDFQVYTGVTKVISDASDVGYTPPVFVANDDGLVFPLTKDQVVISEDVRGSLSAQGAAVSSALSAMAQAAQLAALPSNNLDASAALQRRIRDLSGNNVTTATATHPIWYDVVLKPLSGWRFDSFYNVELTKLTCQRGIDLEAASTP